MTRLTDAELAAMEARANAATPGDWRVVRRTPVMGAFDIEYSRGSPFCANTETLADADFIAAARSDMPRLLAELKAERERCAELQEVASLALQAMDLATCHCPTCAECFDEENDPPCIWEATRERLAKALKETE